MRRLDVRYSRGRLDCADYRIEYWWRCIYSATKQITETVLKRQSEAFRQVVLFDYPCALVAGASVSSPAPPRVKCRT
ncbi:MAG: DUF502 domain-containing protein [Alphaproteobacteria bacterium]